MDVLRRCVTRSPSPYYIHVYIQMVSHPPLGKEVGENLKQDISHGVNHMIPSEYIGKRVA